MTTNVLDNNSKRLASDSRWSLLIGGHLVYVDDTGFDKIADRASAGMICAGDAQLIGAWKEWFLARDQIDLPPTERRLSNGALSPICVTIISKPGFTIDFSSGNYHAYQNLALFCGSGASSAMACFSVNKCSTKCIESAKQHDPMTGGEIKFVNFTDYSHNLTPARASYADAVETLITQGHVMDLTTKNVSKLETGDQRLVREYLNANTVSLSAPMGGVSTAWSESDKQRAQETMRRILAREKAANSF